ncbi:MAG: response regulator [Vallitaleaceae bacterium]|nr:response regulator [Vallitaleaceae bacterium]
MSQSKKNQIGVIIVEDDPMVCRINEGFLDRISGFKHIGSYETIEKAKIAIKELEPGLILLDVYFHGKGAVGVDLLKWIRVNGYDTDVMLVTADDHSQTISNALRLGAVDYLIKPFRFKRFEEALYKYKKIVEDLHGGSSIKQETLDQVLNIVGHDEEETYMPHKNRTYNIINAFLTEHMNKGFTAGQIAEELGISRVTARRYLDVMEKDKIVELVLEYGSIGRPNNKYKIK